MKKLTAKQHAIDSMVFGSIWAGAKTSKKKLRLEVPAMETKKSICAIGAGNRGRKVTRPGDIFRDYHNVHGANEKLHQLVPLVRFATAHGVSENYACGVNDGFEFSTTAAHRFYSEVDRKSQDYERGYHVGQAVRIESGAR